MTDSSTARPKNSATTPQQDNNPLDVLAREFGKTAGEQIGEALADEIHNNPEVRHVAATGAGVGIGVGVGLGLLILLSQ